MELNKKVKLLTWILVFVLLFNVSAFIFIMIQHRNFHDNFPPPFMGQRRPPIHKIITDELNLTPEQQLQYDNLRQNFFGRGKMCLDSIRYYNMQIDLQITSDNPDTVLINQYIDKISNLQKRMKKRSVDYFLEIKSILTPEQKTKFNQLFIQLKQKNKSHRHNFQNR